MSRGRVAAALLGFAAAVVALVLAVGGGLATVTGPTDPGPELRTTVGEFGDRLVMVTVREDRDGPGPADGRVAVLRWSGLALLVVLPLAGGAAWLLAGRHLRAARDREDSLAERARDQEHLLAEVAHELRTPLAVAATNLDLVRVDLVRVDVASVGLGEPLAPRVDAARRAVERMTRAVDDLAVHGQLVVTGRTGAPVDVAAEVADLAAEHAGPAETRHLALVVATSEPVPVRVDRTAVRTAVDNLLANAVRLAPGGSTIRVEVGRSDDWAWIAVRDEGPGIAASDHDAVFRRHWRGRYEVDRDAPDRTAPHRPDAGTRGLGLTIARQAIEAQGGRVTVDSVPGAGSTFVVWLPATADADPNSVVADDGVHHRRDPGAR